MIDSFEMLIENESDVYLVSNYYETNAANSVLNRFELEASVLHVVINAS